MDVFNKLGEYKNFIEIYKNASTIKHQSNAFTDCYNKNQDNFDWFLMIDMDEFLVIVNDALKNYLLQSKFTESENICENCHKEKTLRLPCGCIVCGKFSYQKVKRSLMLLKKKIERYAERL